jgi:uncharacterized protein YneF (UPF0154 family)
MNLKKYKDIDDYISSNGFEILTYEGKVHARFNYLHEYRKHGYDITERKYKEVVASNYLEMTKLLKKEIRGLIHFPLMWFAGTLLSFLSASVLEDVVLIVVMVIFSCMFLFFFVTEFIEYSNTKKVLKSNSVISKDRINMLFQGGFSLFKDEIKSVPR